MIWRPKVGQRVELRYGKRWLKAEFCRALHGQRGTVKIVARGPGPVNVFVELDKWPRTLLTVPRGNLVAVKEAKR